MFIVSDAAEDIRFADNPLVTGAPFIRFYAGCPIRSGDGHRVGTVCLIDTEPRQLPKDEQVLLRDLAEMVEDELSISAQVSVDELTEIANRRGFFMVASHMLSLCKRTNTVAELLYFDLDGLKSTNDTQGHAAGDALLQKFSRLLITCFRDADVVARLGGDEFVVLMTASNRSCDIALARLAEMAGEESPGDTPDLAWSVGKVVYDPLRHNSVQSLLSEGDMRMYQHKESKRTAASC
jgi:diguanylate cyclase (GGDEF)-like protein